MYGRAGEIQPHAVGQPLHRMTRRPDCLQEYSRLKSSSSLIGEMAMSLGTILLIVLVLLLIGALPAWPYSGSWGYYPSGGLGLVLVVLLVLVVMGRI
jgi:hypothetical protein